MSGTDASGSKRAAMETDPYLSDEEIMNNLKIKSPSPAPGSPIPAGTSTVSSSNSGANDPNVIIARLQSQIRSLESKQQQQRQQHPGPLPPIPEDERTCLVCLQIVMFGTAPHQGFELGCCHKLIHNKCQKSWWDMQLSIREEAYIQGDHVDGIITKCMHCRLPVPKPGSVDRKPKRQKHDALVLDVQKVHQELKRIFRVPLKPEDFGEILAKRNSSRPTMLEVMSSRGGNRINNSGQEVLAIMSSITEDISKVASWNYQKRLRDEGNNDWDKYYQ